MDQVLAESAALIEQRLGLSAMAKVSPDPKALAAAHAAGGIGDAEAWLAGWEARVEGRSLDEVAKCYREDMGRQVDAIVGWREAEKHLPPRPAVKHWARRR